MGGVPKQRKTKSRRNQRRMHIYLKAPHLTKCPKCGESLEPHTMCQECGYYKGRQVLDVLKNLKRKERKAKEKEIKQREKERVRQNKPLTLKELSRQQFQ